MSIFEMQLPDARVLLNLYLGCSDKGLYSYKYWHLFFREFLFSRACLLSELGQGNALLPGFSSESPDALRSLESGYFQTLFALKFFVDWSNQQSLALHPEGLAFDKRELIFRISM